MTEGADRGRGKRTDRPTGGLFKNGSVVVQKEAAKEGRLRRVTKLKRPGEAVGGHDKGRSRAEGASIGKGSPQTGDRGVTKKTKKGNGGGKFLDLMGKKTVKPLRLLEPFRAKHNLQGGGCTPGRDLEKGV